MTQNREEENNKNLPDELNPSFIFSGTKSELLSNILNGKIDIIDIAKKEMENRGRDINVKWVGFGYKIKPENFQTKSKFYNYFDKIVIESIDACYVADENIVEKYPDFDSFLVKDTSKCEYLIYSEFPATIN